MCARDHCKRRRVCGLAGPLRVRSCVCVRVRCADCVRATRVACVRVSALTFHVEHFALDSFEM